MERPAVKPLERLGDTRDVIRQLPDPVEDAFGYALWLAQIGARHRNAKALTGLGSAGVLEVVQDDEGDTYRAVYTVKLKKAVYVLCIYQKKSKRGAAIPRRAMRLIEQRLRWAEEMDNEP